jgi:stress response protein SCP2
MSNLTCNGTLVRLESGNGYHPTRITVGLRWKAAPITRKGLLGGTKKVKGPHIPLEVSCVGFDTTGAIVTWLWLNDQDNPFASLHSNGTYSSKRKDKNRADNKVIEIDFDHIPEQIQTVIFSLSGRDGTLFDAVKTVGCQIIDQDTNSEISDFEFNAQGSQSSIVMAKLHRQGDGTWAITLIGQRVYEPDGTWGYLEQAARSYL